MEYGAVNKDTECVVVERAELEALKQKVKRYEEALRFYANEQGWWVMQGNRILIYSRRDDLQYGPVFDEGGEVARKALTE